MTSPRNYAGSVRKALAVLDQVAIDTREGAGSTLTELATVLGYDKSTVLRLCTPLVEAGLLQREPLSSRFTLGRGTLQLGQDYLEGLDLHAVASPHLTRLLKMTGSTCHLVVRDGLSVVYIDKRENTAVVRMASRIGHRLPLYCTAVGKAILASAPADLTKAVIMAGLEPRTTKTLVTADALRAQLSVIRRQGYAIDDGENEPDVRCVGAAVFDHQEVVIGAVSVSALASHTPPRRVRELGELVRLVGDAISASMGSRAAVDRETTFKTR